MNTRKHLRDENRVSSQLEKVFAHSDIGQSDHLLSDIGYQLLDGCPGDAPSIALSRLLLSVESDSELFREAYSLRLTGRALRNLLAEKDGSGDFEIGKAAMPAKLRSSSSVVESALRKRRDCPRPPRPAANGGAARSKGLVLPPGLTPAAPPLRPPAARSSPRLD